VHLGRDDGAGEDTATDGDFASEGALLVCRMGKVLCQLVCFFNIDGVNALVLCSVCG